jgi:hypothetical protein
MEKGTSAAFRREHAGGHPETSGHVGSETDRLRNLFGGILEDIKRRRAQRGQGTFTEAEFESVLSSPLEFTAVTT